MKRFKTILKPLMGIVAVVPFGLIGMLVAALVSKPMPRDPVTVGGQYHEVHNPALSTFTEVEVQVDSRKKSAVGKNPS